MTWLNSILLTKFQAVTGIPIYLHCKKVTKFSPISRKAVGSKRLES